MTLADVCEGICGWRPAGRVPAQSFSTVVVDSRQAQPGSLFVALMGEQADGHDYVAHAFDRGAVAALVGRDVAVDGAVIPLQDFVDTGEFPSSLEGAPPFLLRVADPLLALQQVAAFWRRPVV
ncbi:MAG TPA: hypothetical protein ENF52_00315, partial [Chloroflexi bacterium]|nr:hypothetical protein [Chloroflexota bacterium]